MNLELTDEQTMVVYHSLVLLRESTVGSIGAIEALKNDSQINPIENLDGELQQAKKLLEETDLVLVKLETYIEDSFKENTEPDITTKPEWDQ